MEARPIVHYHLNWTTQVGLIPETLRDTPSYEALKARAATSVRCYGAGLMRKASGT